MANARRIGSRAPACWWCGIALVAVIAAGCSASGSDGTIEPPPAPEGPTTARAELATTPTNGASATTMPEGEDAAGADGALAAWTALWTAGATGDESGLRAMASPEIVAMVEARFDRGDVAEWQSFPAVTASIETASIETASIETASINTATINTATIDDCFFADVPSVLGSTSGWYTGQLERDGDDTWRVVELIETRLLGCVPAAIAADVYRGYEQYWDVRNDRFGGIAPPGSLELAEIATLDHLAELEQIETAIGADAEMDRNDPDRSPEITTMRSPRTVLIRDCQLADPYRGRFDATGERLTEPPDLRQRDMVEVTMVLEDELWKVARLEVQPNASCDRAPTAAAVPEVGP